MKLFNWRSKLSMFKQGFLISVLYATIIMLVGCATLAVSRSTELAVGNKMPSEQILNDQNLSVFHVEPFFSGIDEVVAIAVYLIDANSNERHYMVVFQVCDNIRSEQPFAIYDAILEKLYLDNNPCDGVIDLIVNGNENIQKHTPKDDMPKCPVKFRELSIKDFISI